MKIENAHSLTIDIIKTNEGNYIRYFEDAWYKDFGDTSYMEYGWKELENLYQEYLANIDSDEI